MANIFNNMLTQRHINSVQYA